MVYSARRIAATRPVIVNGYGQSRKAELLRALTHMPASRDVDRSAAQHRGVRALGCPFVAVNARLRGIIRSTTSVEGMIPNARASHEHERPLYRRDELLAAAGRRRRPFPFGHVHAPCHLQHAQRVTQAPLSVLARSLVSSSFLHDSDSMLRKRRHLQSHEPDTSDACSRPNWQHCGDWRAWSHGNFFRVV